MWPDPQSPLVCVVMPAYRAAETVAAAARTVLAQDYANLVLGIAVPVARDSETASAVGSLGDSRVVLIEQADRGISDARNLVLRRITADLYMFLDADDFMMPGVISAYVRHRVETGTPGLRYGHYVRGVLGDTSPPERRPAPYLGLVRHAFARMCIMSFVATGSIMIDREVVDQIGYFDTRFNHAEDWHYWLRVTRQFPVFGLDIVAYHYTYAKLSRPDPFPRTFFDDGTRIASELCRPYPLRLLSLMWIRTQYAIYYARTFRGRRSIRQLMDIRAGDVFAIPFGLLLYLMRRLHIA